MNTRLTALSAALCAVVSVSALAQEDDYQAPSTAYGDPDLQGVWKNATVTPLQRPAELGEQQAYTEEEAYALERAAQMAVEQDNEPLDPNRPPPPKEDLPPVGNYDLFWTDRGMTIPTINGEKRTSIIIDPPNGRIPPYTEEYQERRRLEMAEGPGRFDGPEGLSVGERCLLSFGSSSGPPMLPVMYNSHYQIVQSPGYVAIIVEMVHDARIIRLDDEHMDPVMNKWMGDSVGHWDGDTLVVETKHFNPQQSFRGASENMTVTEHFTRVADDKIVYRFTVDDPTVFASSFTGEIPFSGVDEGLYEYACHEGNYSLPGILAGARRAEAEEAAQAAD